MAKRANLRLMAVAVMVVLMGASSAWADVTEGLVAHWELDGDATDSVGGNHGTIYGATTTAGQINDALYFNGVNSYVRLPKLILDDFTLVFWVKTTQTAPNSSGWWNGYGLVDAEKRGHLRDWGTALTGGKVAFGIGGSVSELITIKSTSTINDGDWFFVSATRDKNTGKIALYINAVKEAEGSGITSTLDQIDYIGIGNNSSDVRDGDEWFDGKIDDVRIYDRVLSAVEVEALYLESTHELTGLEIVGPAEVAENFDAGYKAMAVYDDNSTRDVTALVVWSVDQNDNCSIAAGLLTTETIDLPEDVTITAKYGEGIEPAKKDVSILMICPSGSALEFDGVDDYVDCGNDESLDIRDSLTLAAWVKNNSDNDGQIIWRGDAQGAHDPYMLHITGGKMVFRIDVGAGYNVYRAKSNENVDNLWHFWVGVHDKDKNIIFLYKDGMLENKTDVLHEIEYETSSMWNMIGAVDQGTWQNFRGMIDEVAIFNRALSADEVQYLMHIRPDTSDPALVGYWGFDEGEGDIAYDLSLYGNHGQLSSTEYCDPEDPACSDLYPTWFVSDAPVGICSLEGIVERNLSDVLNSKQSIKEQLDETMAQEEALREYMDLVFKDRNFGNTRKGDVVKAKQQIHSAVKQEEQAGTAIDQSVDKIYDAMEALGIK